MHPTPLDHNRTEYRDQDLAGARFERVNLREALFSRVQLTGASTRSIDLSGVHIRSSLLAESRLRGVELESVQISGELLNVVVNGVDIAPLVAAELNRRRPDRAAMRLESAAGFSAAWAILERLWAQTLAFALSAPEEVLHRSVDYEWSFIQTLRHLNFATGSWVQRMKQKIPLPWHVLDLPWDEALAWKGMSWQRDAQPGLQEVLAVRKDRRAAVREVLRTLTEEQLASHVSCAEPGWPRMENVPLREWLLIVLNEEWEHRLYAERDLTALLGALTTTSDGSF